MRIGSFLLVLVCAQGCFAAAQDIGQTVMLNQQSMQSMTGNSQSVQINLHGPQLTANGKPTGNYAVPEAKRTWLECGCAKPPVFPVGAGDLPTGTQVTITGASPDAVIFYTTDGWTPTEASTRYTGPITINSDTRLQAFAVEPNKLPSTIAEVTYTVNGSPAHGQESALARDGILLKDTPLRLVTGGEVSSETAQVGDRILLLLDQNVMVGETIVAPKGTPVEASITRVERAGRAGKPGVIAFQVQSLNAHGIHVPLNATLTLAATNTAAEAQRISNPTMIHVVGALPPGEDADIERGMALTASVGADTPLHP